MAAEAPANNHEYLLRLMKLVERYDFEKLLDAATAFQDWTVISDNEKREIESQICNQSRLDRLMTLIAETGRETRFANFILRYNSSIQDAALAIMNANRPMVNIAGSEMRPTGAAPISTVTSSQIRPEKTLQQPAGGSQKSNATATGSPMELDTTESPEPCSMDTNSKENLCTQYDNLSNSSQESPDFGYCSGSSKDFQSQNHPAGGGDRHPFFQSPQQNLKVIQKNQRSRQRELKRMEKHQRNVFQPTVTVVNHQVHNYHISPQRDLVQPVTPQWLRPVMDHCPQIIQTLNMGILTPYLLQNGLLAPSECQQLDALGTPRNQAQHFLINVLPTKGEEGLKKFLKCLKEETDHSGHQDLFRLLGSSRF